MFKIKYKKKPKLPPLSLPFAGVIYIDQFAFVPFFSPSEMRVYKWFENTGWHFNVRKAKRETYTRIKDSPKDYKQYLMEDEIARKWYKDE